MLTALILLLMYYFSTNFDVESAEMLYRKSSGNGGCMVDVSVNDFPLVIQRKTSRVFFPQDTWRPYMRFALKETVEFCCPNSTIVLRGRNSGLRSVYATCMFTERKHFAWNDISCHETVNAEIYDTPELCANGAGYFYEVALEFHDSAYQNVYTICYSPETYVPLFTFHNITALRHDDLMEPGSFDDSPPLQFEMPWIYELQQQRDTVNEILGLFNNSKRYIDDDNYLEPLLLVSKYDFYYTSYRNSIYKNHNSAPMWKSIKQGNWADIEKEIREFVRKTNDSLQVWTGTYGNLTLPDANGENNDNYIYLNSKDNVTEKLIVPSLLWKVIYDEDKISSIAFVTINNPYYRNFSELIICPDISMYAGWFEFGKSKDKTRGYSYACAIEDFREVINYFPDLDSNYLLAKNPMPIDAFEIPEPME